MFRTDSPERCHGLKQMPRKKTPAKLVQDRGHSRNYRITIIVLDVFEMYMYKGGTQSDMIQPSIRLQFCYQVNTHNSILPCETGCFYCPTGFRRTVIYNIVRLTYLLTCLSVWLSDGILTAAPYWFWQRKLQQLGRLWTYTNGIDFSMNLLISHVLSWQMLVTPGIFIQAAIDHGARRTKSPSGV